MASKEKPRAVSLLVEIPDQLTDDEAKYLTEALRLSVLEFAYATHTPSEDFKIHSVSGPAAPIRVGDLTLDKSAQLPALVARYKKRG